MDTVRHLIRHPAGKVGLSIGLTIGIFAALMGEASKALFVVWFCNNLAERV
jgi:hypothetical protein